MSEPASLAQVFGAERRLKGIPKAHSQDSYEAPQVSKASRGFLVLKAAGRAATVGAWVHSAPESPFDASCARNAND
jgi:hypothetical protein